MSVTAHPIFLLQLQLELQKLVYISRKAKLKHAVT